MSDLPPLFRRFEKALQVLELESTRTVEPEALRARYREAVRKHPPDRDPEGFRRVREAYEQISDPHAALLDALVQEHPHVAAPEPTVVMAQRGETLQVLLRAHVGQMDSEGLLAHLEPGETTT